MKKSKFPLLSFLVLIFIFIVSSLSLASPRARARATIASANKEKTIKYKYITRSTANKRYYRMASKSLSKAYASYRKGLYYQASSYGRKARRYFRKIKIIRKFSRKLDKKAKMYLLRAKKKYASRLRYLKRVRKKWLKTSSGKSRYLLDNSRLQTAKKLIHSAIKRYKKRRYELSIITSKNVLSFLK